MKCSSSSNSLVFKKKKLLESITVASITVLIVLLSAAASSNTCEAATSATKAMRASFSFCVPSRVAAFTATTTASACCHHFQRSPRTQTILLAANSNKNFLDTFTRSFSVAAGIEQPYYTLGITGGNGLIGTALQREITTNTYTINNKPIRIVILKRSNDQQPSTPPTRPQGSANASIVTTATYNPYSTNPDTVFSKKLCEQLDGVVHLAGENVATGLGPLGFLGIRPWTDAKKKEILDSRVGPTTAITNALAAAASKASCSKSKKEIDYLCASGVGIYGDEYTENDTPASDMDATKPDTSGFLAQISREWESATKPAATGVRAVNLRFGVVLSSAGGALAKLIPIFKLGGGGVIGSSRQSFSFVSSADAACAILHILQTKSVTGPVNVCAPNPTTNYGFTKALGTALSRPTILPLPSFVVDLLFGQMGMEMLVGGVKCVPTKLQSSNFQFRHPTILDAVKYACK